MKDVNRSHTDEKHLATMWAIWEPTCYYCGYYWVETGLLDRDEPTECPNCDYQPVKLLYPCDFEDMEDQDVS